MDLQTAVAASMLPDVAGDRRRGIQGASARSRRWAAVPRTSLGGLRAGVTRSAVSRSTSSDAPAARALEAGQRLRNRRHRPVRPAVSRRCSPARTTRRPFSGREAVSTALERTSRGDRGLARGDALRAPGGGPARPGSWRSAELSWPAAWREASTRRHTAAVSTAGGPTIAVQGCGLDRVYPAEHADLAAEIAENGLMLAELAPGRRPFPSTSRCGTASSAGSPSPRSSSKPRSRAARSSRPGVRWNRGATSWRCRGASFQGATGARTRS